ncbi:hypothetical protein Z517_09190 [Fonsecaea pedrosoi CBS 271.37]|uniref:Uncharacterized protein n=1 Tax=Fonsecaea pedrosoi CBS 271.37 TaxID=1442368 RepID=A0A0D2DGD6_9EURO|nr:uncharacterized protein Z517_09190 [Fonsecaea pedrosoi CBS 271.37]KIW76746.1 hypothetical protein Z517_09190 [Fonsecaea pedrosoi CBS 271.37]
MRIAKFEFTTIMTSTVNNGHFGALLLLLVGPPLPGLAGRTRTSLNAPSIVMLLMIPGTFDLVSKALSTDVSTAMTAATAPTRQQSSQSMPGLPQPPIPESGMVRAITRTSEARVTVAEKVAVEARREQNEDADAWERDKRTLEAQKTRLEEQVERLRVYSELGSQAMLVAGAMESLIFVQRESEWWSMGSWWTRTTLRYGLLID